MVPGAVPSKRAAVSISIAFAARRRTPSWPLVLAVLPACAALAAEPALQLPSIVVTSSLTEQDARDAAGSVTLIDRDRIDRSAARDLFDAVRGTPGVSVVGRGLSGRRVVNIRGLDSKHVLLLTDGRRITPTDEYIGHSDYGYSWLPLVDVERIEVVRGPLSALYGSDAMGGVINVITRPVSDRLVGEVKALGGTPDHGRGGGEVQLGASLSGPLVADRLGFKLSLQDVRVQDTALPDDDRLSELEGREVRNGTAALTFVPATGHRLELGLVGGEEERWRDTDDSGEPPYYTSTYELWRSQAHASYRGEIGVARLGLNLYRSSIDQKNLTDDPSVAPTTRQKLVEDVVDAHVSIPVLERHRLTLGGEYREETLEHEALRRGKDTADNRALFVQDEWSLREDLTLTLGLRQDDQRFFGAETSPRAYLVYHPSDDWTLRGGYGQGFKAPTLKQLSPEYSFTGYHSFRGNPDLEPERSENYELGAEYFGRLFDASLTLFRNELQDLIATECVVNCTQRIGRVFEYINLSEARTQGVESSLTLRLPHGVGLGLNYTYLDARDLSNDRPLAERPRSSLGLRLSWDGAPWGLRPELRLDYIGEQVIYDASTRYQLPGYSLLGLSVQKDLAPNLRLTVGVDNLTDVYLADESEYFGYTERGRFLYASVQARFE